MHIHPLMSNPVYWVDRAALSSLETLPTGELTGRVTQLYGVSPNGVSLRTGARPAGFTEEPLPLSVLSQQTGQWGALVTIAHPGERLMAAITDFHGFQRLYVVDVVLPSGNHWAVCHDFDTAGAIAARFGRGEINWPVIRPTLISNHNFMTGTWSNSTWHTAIQEVTPTQMLILASDGLAPVTRPFTRDPNGRSYEELVTAGIERATNQLLEIASSEEDMILYLSGGRDSRMCLALALGAGLGQRIRISSENPADYPAGSSRDTVARDLAVSQLLETEYGLQRHTPAGATCQSRTYLTALREFQAARSGLSFNFDPDALRRRPLAPRYEIRGAGGELIRSAYSGYGKTEWWDRLISDDAQALRTDSRSLFGVVTRGHLLPKASFATSRNSFVESLELVPEAPLSEQLSAHYSLHRNRGHFGALDAAAASNRWLVYPLAQPEFVFGAQHMPFAARKAGRLAYDIIERTEPSLNRIGFEDAPGWPDEVYSHAGETVPPQPEPIPPLDETAEQYLQGLFEQRSRRTTVVGEPKFSNGVQRSASYFREALAVLRQQFPEELDTTFTEGLLNLAQRGQLNFHQSAVRMSSLLSMAEEAPIPSALHLSALPNGTSTLPPRVLLDLLHPSPPPPTVEALEMDVSTSFEDQRIHVTATVADSTQAAKEYAFYLNKNGVPVQRTMYQAEPSHDFELDDSPSEHSVSVFVRRVGTDSFALRVEQALPRPQLPECSSGSDLPTG